MDESTKDVLKEFTRLVDKFCDSTTAHQEQNSVIAQRFADLSKETEKHFERLSLQDKKHTEAILNQERKFHDATDARRRKESYLVSALAFCGAAVTALFAYMWHIESRKLDIEKMTMAQKFHREDVIQQEIHHVRGVINRDFSLRDQLMDAMASYRGIRDFGQKYCVNGQYAGKNPSEYQEKLFVAGYKLVGSCYKVISVFNDDVNKQVSNFLAISSVDNGNICVKDAATDSELRSLQENIDKSILAAINELQNQKQKLNEELGESDEKNIR